MKCNLCESETFKNVLYFPHKSMTSDSRVVSIPLEKIQCTTCGLITNKKSFDYDYLRSHYLNHYELGSNSDKSEPLIYLDKKTVTRSEALFEWIDTSLSDISKNSIFEIGCSDGKVLKHFQKKYDFSQQYGIDLSISSINIAIEDGLNVECKAIEDVDVNNKYDIIYSIAVIEHLESPDKFFKQCYDLMTEKGVLIVIQPTQDVIIHDIFFSDHIFHFTNKHIEMYGNKNGFELKNQMLGDKYGLYGFVLTIFSKSKIAPKDISVLLSINKNINYYLELFKKVDNWLKDNEDNKIAIWGVGEVYTLLSIYCNLVNDDNIDIRFDNNFKRYKNVQNPTKEILLNYKDHKFLLTFKPNMKNSIFKEIDSVSIYNL